MSTIKTNTIQPINASDSLKIRTNDLDSLTVTSSGDITVRNALNVDSGTLFVNATNDRVGIGTVVPNVPLDVRGGSVRADTSGSFEQSVAFAANHGGWARGLHFVDSNATTTMTGITGGIGMLGANTTTTRLFLGFGDTPWNSAGQAGGVFILKTGNIGIGTDNPAVALDVNGEARSSTSTTSSSHANTLVTKNYVDFSIDPFVLTVDDLANAGRLSNSAPGSTVARTSGGVITQPDATTIRVRDLKIGRVHTRVHRTVSSATPNYQPFTAWYIDNTNAVSLVWTAFYTTGNSTTFSGSLSTNLTMTPLTVIPYNSTPHYFAGSMHTSSSYGYSVVWVLRIG